MTHQTEIDHRQQRNGDVGDNIGNGKTKDTTIQQSKFLRVQRWGFLPRRHGEHGQTPRYFFAFSDGSTIFKAIRLNRNYSPDRQNFSSVFLCALSASVVYFLKNRKSSTRFFRSVRVSLPHIFFRSTIVELYFVRPIFPVRGTIHKKCLSPPA